MQVFPFIYKIEIIAYIQIHTHDVWKKLNKCNFSSISKQSRQDVTFIKRLNVKCLLYLYLYTFTAHITWNKRCFISQRSLSLCISIVKTVQTSIHIFSLWTHWQLCMNVHSTTGKTGSPTQWTGSPHPPTVLTLSSVCFASKGWCYWIQWEALEQFYTFIYTIMF